MAIMCNPNWKLFLCSCSFFLFLISKQFSAQKICSNCGSMRIPYPLSTDPACGDPEYSLHCDTSSEKLYFNALNGSSYVVTKIIGAMCRLVVQPAPWISDTCVTEDMTMSEGMWLNQSLPFNITSSNTIFLFNCSPRLLVSPLNCTQSSLCHRYLESSGHVDKKRSAECTGYLDPCCTFIAGGMPSAYKIRLHSSGCRAFRSILHLDPKQPPGQWEEGLEIQWAPPPEPVCISQKDCSHESECSPVAANGLHRCLCKRGFQWNPALAICLKQKKQALSDLGLKVSAGLGSFLAFSVVVAVISLKRSNKYSNRSKLVKQREDMLKSSNNGKAARMFSLKDVKKATNNFSRERFLGSGGFGEVYRGELPDGTIVAVKSAKMGNIKGTEQVLNEVGILSQVNHKNLVKLLGCCVESEQPLMIYEYIANGTLHDHLHGGTSSLLDWNTRLKISLQNAEALAYLHSSAHTPIFHRDVKSTNILLDGEFNAKVADFGLSRLAHPGLSHVSTCAQGTVGYLDPEYYRNYQLTDKSDVYSYGVVLLELLTSKKAIDFTRDQDNVNLVIYVSQCATRGTVMEVVDQQLVGEEPSADKLNSFMLIAQLALACVNEKKDKRPSMKDVVEQLQCIIRTLSQDPKCSYEIITEIIDV